MLSLKSIILEGRYDKITGEVSKHIFDYLKKTKKLFDSGKEDKRGADGFTEEIIGRYKEPLDFYLVIRLNRNTKFTGDLAINGATYDKRKSVDGEYIALIEVELTLNPEYEPKVYNVLNPVLQDTVRHELEHLTQGGINLKPGKPARTLQSTRAKIKSYKGSAYKYFTLRDEIPAQVQGLYRKAKMEKRPLKDVMEEYAEYWHEQGNITEYEKNHILKLWTAFAKKNLPKAKL